MTRGSVRLATRGSDLALRQTATVRDALEARRYDVEIVEVETRGDRLDEALIRELGRTGAFVRELDRRVLDGSADAAVHSMKDMPTDFPETLIVGGVPDRAPAGDVLVTPDGSDLSDLSPGSTVGTSSLRRKAQLLAQRSDLSIEPLRGNVDTRVEKLLAPSLQREHERRLQAATNDETPSEITVDDPTPESRQFEDPGDEGRCDETPTEWFEGLSELERRAMERTPDTHYDAIVLAEAGLRRAGLFDRVGTSRLSRDSFVPAPGQGALAVTTTEPEMTDAVRRALDHPPTRVTTTVERTILEELGGGCVAPIGVHALLQGDRVRVRVRVLSTDGSDEISGTRDLAVGRHAQEAESFAAELRGDGAADLIETARAEAGDGGTRDD